MIPRIVAPTRCRRADRQQGRDVIPPDRVRPVFRQRFPHVEAGGISGALRSGVADVTGYVQALGQLRNGRF